MNSILFKTKYTGTSFTRKYEIEDVKNEDIIINTVRNKVIAINQSIEGGQANDLISIFVSDDYNASQNIGTLENIYDVKIKTVTETEIPQTTGTRNADFDFNEFYKSKEEEMK